MSSDASSDYEPEHVKAPVAASSAKSSQSSAAVGIPIGDKTAIDKLLAYQYPTTGDSPDGEELFLVKFKNCSYYNASWITRARIIELNGKMGNAQIKRFLNKHEESRWSVEDAFNPDYKRIDRIFNEGIDGDQVYFLVKWQSLTYDQSTWESSETVEEIDPDKITEFHDRSYIPAAKTTKKRLPAFEELSESPVYNNGKELRHYQLEGLSWLVHCYYQNRNSILADEMGLGKTIQATAFLHHLYYKLGVTGPFLIVVPLSTIGNWIRELDTWTNLNTVVYHGNDTARNLIADGEFFYRNENDELVTRIYKFDIILTTYEMVNTAHLKSITWKCVILDEAHKLKNKDSKISDTLKNFHFEHKVLLSGTVIQNSIEELWSLLNFLEPTQFSSLHDFQQDFGNLTEHADVIRLQEILRPLMLRRLKEDVEKDIPILEETVIEVELTNIQMKYYKSIIEQNFTWLKLGTKTKNLPRLMNVMMELRKCCLHPFLINGAEEQIFAEFNASNPESQMNAIIQASGKMVLIDKLLTKLHADGHKVLIFSQMTRCLDILQDYLNSKDFGYERIDGSVRGDIRQAAIDRFSHPESKKFVFLLCTRAGGVGINLTVADTVIIFDSDWNPQNDLQAQSRCHRIGQKKAVKVYRLITRNTYEQEMFNTASMKLGLDRAVLQRMDAQSSMAAINPLLNPSTTSSTSNAPSSLSKSQVENLLKKGAYCFLDTTESQAFCEETIDSILERRTQVIKHDNGGAERSSIFSKASFSANANANGGVAIQMDDPNFWEKIREQGDLNTIDIVKEENPLIQNEPRSRRAATRHSDSISAAIKAKDDEYVTNLDSQMMDSDESDIDAGATGDDFNDSKKKRIFIKRELIEFRRVLMSFGVELNADGTKNWDRFRILAVLKQNDTEMNDQYRKTISMAKECIRIAEASSKDTSVHGSDNEGERPIIESSFNPKNVRVDKGSESISYDASKRVLKRIQMMKRLRMQVLAHPNLDEHLALMKNKKWGWLPPWWSIPSMDRAFLEGISKHGFVRNDLLLLDESLPFHAIYQAHLNDPTELVKSNSKDFWMTENVSTRRFDYLCDVVMNPAVLTTKKTRNRKSKYRPDGEQLDPAAAAVVALATTGAAKKKSIKRSKKLEEVSADIVSSESENEAEHKPDIDEPALKKPKLCVKSIADMETTNEADAIESTTVLPSQSFVKDAAGMAEHDGTELARQIPTSLPESVEVVPLHNMPVLNPTEI